MILMILILLSGSPLPGGCLSGLQSGTRKISDNPLSAYHICQNVRSVSSIRVQPRLPLRNSKFVISTVVSEAASALSSFRATVA
jgi:hypothetical protein